MGGVKLSEELREKFDDLAADSEAIQAKYVSFSTAIHDEQKIMLARAKALWMHTIETMGLEGQWRYDDGKLYPMDEPETK